MITVSGSYSPHLFITRLWVRFRYIRILFSFVTCQCIRARFVFRESTSILHLLTFFRPSFPFTIRTHSYLLVIFSLSVTMPPRTTSKTCANYKASHPRSDHSEYCPNCRPSQQFTTSVCRVCHRSYTDIRHSSHVSQASQESQPSSQQPLGVVFQ